MSLPKPCYDTLKPPFPWFGGKSRVAHVVWQRFGDVANYVEPFFGSGAVLFGRPHEPRVETVNDADCYLSNFWRAVQHASEEVAAWCDWPVNECDLHARHRWLLDRAEFRKRMMDDPDYYDAKIAGWWVWGLCQWIGSGWCDSRFYIEGEWKQLPHLGNPGMGVHRPSQKLPHLGDPGRGVHRPSQKRPHLGDPGRGELYDYFAALAARMRRVRVCCGDWTRIMGPTPTRSNGTTGVFLDPPYGNSRKEGLYGMDDVTVAAAVRHWAVEHEGDNALRIALCGYDGETEMPAAWECVAWKAAGGYGSQGNERGRDNAHRERIWFSPSCRAAQAQQVIQFED